jgi:hypothetical protein
MEALITSYLEGLDLAAPIRERADALVEAFQFIGGESVNRVFVAELERGIHDSGERWESLWGFSDSFWYQARDFPREPNDIDASPLLNSVSYIGVKYSGFIIGAEGISGVVTSSRMSVEVETGGHVYSSIAASGGNCEELCDIVHTVLSPNLRMSGPE